MYLRPSSNLQGVTGQKVVVAGETELKIDRLQRPVTVRVVDKLHQEMILGADVLGGARIDLRKRLLTLHGKQWPLRNYDHLEVAGMGQVLPETGNSRFNALLRKNADVFSAKGEPNGHCNLSPMTITTNGPPICQAAYRTPLHKRQLVDEAIDEMLADGIIRPSVSAWASPVTLVPKKDGSTRFCVDYRKLNAVTEKDRYPLPLIIDVFDQIGGSSIFSALDLKSGYWQIPMDVESIPKTAFRCHRGLFEFNAMPFGLATAPSWFQRIMDNVFEGLIGKICLVYLDDIVIFSKTEADHLKHLQLVFDRLRTAGLRLKPTKCQFGLKQIKLLGHIVNARGIQTDPDKVKAITNLSPPSSVREIRSFLGMTGYYRALIPNYAHIAEPLTGLTRKNIRFKWGPAQRVAFNTLKELLVSSDVMAAPRLDRPFKLYTDASDYAVGGILVQDDDNKVERVIQYISHVLSPTQKKWATIEKEAYAVVYAIEKLRAYLFGADFTVYTDHKPLNSLFTKEMRNTRIQRWGLLLSEFGAKIRYHSGKLNIRADMLSRIKPPTFPEVCVIDTDDWVSPEAFPDEIIADTLPLEYDGLDLDKIQKDQETEFSAERLAALNEESNYTLIKGVLYSIARPNPTTPTYPRLILPSAYRASVISRAHKEVGHMSVAKTFSRVLEAYVWTGMRRDIKTKLAACPICQAHSRREDKVAMGDMPLANYPMQIVGADLIGPFIVSPEGHRYILTIIDHCTGWAEAIPLKDKTNASVWQAFANHFFPTHFYPEILITDNGTEFCAHNWEKYLKSVGIDHRRTTPRHPASNGKAERFNKSLKAMLSKFANNETATWESRLADVLLAYRTSVSSVTGYTPFYLLYGRRNRMPLTKLLKVRQSNYFGSRLDDLAEALKMARHLTLESRRYNKKRLQQRANANDIKVGNTVVVKAEERLTFTSRWDVQYEVYRVRGTTLWIKHQTTGKTRKVHREKCRLVDPNISWDEVRPRPLRTRTHTLPAGRTDVNRSSVLPDSRQPTASAGQRPRRSTRSVHKPDAAVSIPPLVLQKSQNTWRIITPTDSPSHHPVSRKRRLTPPSPDLLKRARCELLSFVSHF